LRTLLFTLLIFIMIITNGKIPAADKDKHRHPLHTVSSVDLDRYIGLWYEIAKLPNPFQQKCVQNTTAEYQLMPNGKIQVINRCETGNNDTISIQGVAKISDQKTNAKLKVSFVNILGINLFWGNYWIIGLENDYQYALVGEPKRKYGWILSRTPYLSESHWQEVNKILINKGYDPDEFIKTKQE